MKIKLLLRRFPLLTRLLKFARFHLGRGYMTLCHALLGVDKDAVFFSSFAGRAYNDNPRFICEALMKRRPGLRIIWQLNRDASGADRLPGAVVRVRAHSPRALRAAATSRVIVDNFNRPFYMRKFSDQFYIQTWHGDRGMKKILFDLNDGKDYPDRKRMDLAVAGSDFGEAIFRSAFRYEGNVLKCGMPRNDLLLHPDGELARRVRIRLGLDPDCRVLLYAPTFRDQDKFRKIVANVDLAAVLQELEQSTGCRWVGLARGHANNPGVIAEGCTDVTAYPELAELLLITDLLITDYSSCAGDFALLNRPFVLYQPDRARFESTNREFYFDLDASPYPIAQSPEQLMEMLHDLPALAARAPELLKFYGACESGCASETIADVIVKTLEASGSPGQ